MSGIERRTSCNPQLMSCQETETNEIDETKKTASATASRDPRVSPRADRPPPRAEGAYASAAAIAAVRASNMQPSGAMASQDLALLPEAALDHQAAALRTRLSNPSYPSRESDAAELVSVEKELVRRESVRAKEARDLHGGVKLCRRTADLPGSSVHGAQHWWLQTTRKEAGMGPATGNVPGHGESLPESFDTKIIDHSGEPKTDCTPVIADEDCVDRELQIGQPTGTWIPGINDCHTVVKAIVAKCRQESIDKALDLERTRNDGAAGAR